MAFELHPGLAADTIELGSFPLSRLLLMNDSRYPWCVLVPQRENVREIHELAESDRLQLLHEITRLSEQMQASFEAHKMNVAALGNQVPQLHIHVIARQTSDPAWPGPVWGIGNAVAYDAASAAALHDRLVSRLGPGFQDASDLGG